MLEIIIIFIVIVAVFASVAWFAMRSTRQQKLNSLSEHVNRVEPDLDDSNAFSAVLEQEMTQHTISTSIDDEPSVSVSEQAQQAETTQSELASKQNEINFKLNDDIDLDTAIVEQAEPSINLVNDWDMVIAFTIMAGEGKTFSGKDIKFALESERFQHDDTQLFHRLTAQKQPLFSVANVLAPGIFDVQNIQNLATPGILIFAKLPGPINGLTLFEDLLETSQILSEKLSGVLCDDSRQAVTEESLEAMRSRILSLNFSIHSESQDAHDYSH